MKRHVTDVTNCTNMNLRQANRLMTRVFDAELQLTGLKATQFTLLATLQALGDPPLSKLAEAMVMDRTTLTRNLKPLVEKGFIKIGTEQDQRVKQILLTPKGKQCLADAMPHWEHIQQKVVKSMGVKRWAQFLDDLETTVKIMKEF